MLHLQFTTCTLALALILLPGQHSVAQDTPPCDDQRLLPAQIRCHLDIAEEAGGAEPCRQAQNAVVRFHCISLFAEHNHDAEACRLIASDDPESATLRDACVAGVGIAVRDPAVCAQVGQRKLADACFVQLVVEHGADASLCLEVQNPLLRDACSDARAQ